MNEQQLYEHLKKRVKALSKKTGRNFNILWQQLILERFLSRTANSKYKENLVFKGGRLLAHYLPLGRETVDLDFSLRNFDTESFKKVIDEVISVKVENDFNFEVVKIEKTEHASTEYGGHKIFLMAKLAATITHLSIDVGVGDLILPDKIKVDFIKDEEGPVFEPSVEVYVYPPEFIFSEKLQTIAWRGKGNTRMKDFYDLALLIESNLLDTSKVKKSIEMTFSNRETKLIDLIDFDSDALKRMNKHWDDFKKGIKEKSIVEKFSQIELVIEIINKYLALVNASKKD